MTYQPGTMRVTAYISLGLLLACVKLQSDLLFKLMLQHCYSNILNFYLNKNDNYDLAFKAKLDL